VKRRQVELKRQWIDTTVFLNADWQRDAHFAEGDHSFHGITITRFGHHDRSEATLWS